MLKNFKLVNTDGLTGLRYKGRTIPFNKIDDTMAEQLIGKTHVLERVAEAPATAPVVLALAEPTAEAEAPTSTKAKK